MLDDLVLSSTSAAVIDAEMKNMHKSSWLFARLQSRTTGCSPECERGDVHWT